MRPLGVLITRHQASATAGDGGQCPDVAVPRSTRPTTSTTSGGRLRSGRCRAAAS